MARPNQQYAARKTIFQGDEISAHAVLVPKWSEFAIVAAATIIAFLVYTNAENVTETANFLAPTLLAIAFGIGSVQLLRKSIAAIWTPIFWLRVSGMAFVGVGSIVPYFLNNESRNMIEAFFSFYPVDVAKYNLVNCLFFLIFMTFFSVVSNFIFNRSNFSARFRFEKSALNIGKLGILLLGVGLFLQLAFVFPAQLGLYDTVFPAIFGWL